MKIKPFPRNLKLLHSCYLKPLWYSCPWCVLSQTRSREQMEWQQFSQAVLKELYIPTQANVMLVVGVSINRPDEFHNREREREIISPSRGMWGPWNQEAGKTPMEGFEDDEWRERDREREFWLSRIWRFMKLKSTERVGFVNVFFLLGIPVPPLPEQSSSAFGISVN